MAKLLSPRGYLSWTQVDMWERNRERYIRKYIHGENIDIRNSGIDYGKKVATALEDGIETGDVLTDAIITLLPAYSVNEHEITVPMATQWGDTVLMGKIDTFDPETLSFMEHKTGRVKWTYGKAEKHGQMRHYATLIWLKHKKLPPRAQLNWIQTEEVDGVVRPTGKIEPFNIQLGMREVLEYMARVAKVAKEIDEVYRAELKKLT